ncbi:MAG: twitching motility protein, partial [Verrucomicrobiota bacterium]|nr:twitching motility protein [Verrucomicrobiota bacterium]
EGRTFQEIIEAGGTMGWHSFDQCLLDAYKEDIITDETAMIFCAHKNKMRRDLDMLHKLRGQTFDEPSGLQLETPTLVMK